MQIGFIGLGLMGAGMAANLQKAGHKLVIHDLNRAAAEKHLAAGAVWANSPREVGEQVELVFTSLPAPPDVEKVALSENGLLAGLNQGCVWFDLTTNSVPMVRKLQGIFAERGIQFMDAPVSGGPAGANSGKLAIWVGGDAAAFEKYSHVLDDFADQARYTGPIGSGAIAKLVHNAATATVSAALAEVMTLGIKAGLEPLPLWEAVRQGAGGRARLFDRLGNYFLTGKYDPPGFALKLLHKDVSLASQLGWEMNVPMKLVNTALQDLTEALNRGWGNRDSNVAGAMQVERAGLPPLAESPEAVKAVLERDGKKS